MAVLEGFWLAPVSFRILPPQPILLIVLNLFLLFLTRHGFLTIELCSAPEETTSAKSACSNPAGLLSHPADDCANP